MLKLPLFTDQPINAETLEGNVRQSETGAVVTFQSVVRPDRSDTGRLDHMIFVVHENVARARVAKLLAEFPRRWPGAEVAVQHRAGRVAVGETSVFIAVSSPSRAHAFEACRFLVEHLKSAMGIHKTDVYTDGTRCESDVSHEAMLLSDEAISLPES